MNKIKCPNCGISVPDVKPTSAENIPHEEILCNACWELEDKAIHVYEAEQYNKLVQEEVANNERSGGRND